MIPIPKGKQIILTKGTKTVAEGIPLVLDTDITLSLSSTFSTLLGSSSTKAINFVGQLFGLFTKGKIAFSGQFRQLGFQMWSSTDPLKFSVTLNFYMGTTEANSAEIEVYNPIIELANLALPDVNPLGGKRIGNLIGPGPYFSDASGFELSNDKTMAVQIGTILYLSSIIVTRAEPTFSSEVDDQGYPISGKLTLDIMSTTTATITMLSQRVKPTNIPPGSSPYGLQGSIL